MPQLFLSGLMESYVPPAMMKQMHDLAVQSSLQEFVKFEDRTHNQTWATEGSFDSVARFIDRVERERTGAATYDTGKVQSVTREK